ncbi:flavin-containing monooxygenase [Histoplasma capsulatum var. duboisii H88]|uniref:Flavin-containing monooxygenase 1 n=2 Tax=Ajellomyces capsulatus TaxID=5037 RepID=F0UT05_AJEC8|nr:flavin containing monooxygenase [Histoplasma capsulatum H143]EGC49032.1 flavin-containing monooxygenase [Histoplasma capsulatum var. duboisii H88]QSS54626.1 flavin-containing monooxygenase [Histoplasma capsulatum var. duboisii H88]
MTAKKVAIIGGGPSGLTTLKECLDNGLDAVVFEGRNGIGGQWRYEDPDPETDDAVSSIYEGVILNSARDTSCFSDFPIDPAQYPTYFSHRRMLNYLEDYASHFGLGKYIQLNTKVLSCNQLPDGRWTVVHEKKGADQITSEYDAIFACTGHNSYPSTPDFEGMSSFQGEILHSHVYRRPARFEGKKVALIGFGSSAVDLACELVPAAKEVHMVTRRGGWIIPRYVLGQPVESYDNRIAETLLPDSLSQWVQTKIMDFAIGKHPEVIKPDHKILQASVTVHSNLIEFINVGKVKVHRAGVKQFTETSLVLTNGAELDVDVVICCTGYHMDMPYLPKETYHVKDNPILKSPNTLDLYRLVVSPRFPNLFFIGYVELPGPLFPVAESQARWASGIVTGKVKLPSADEMTQQVKEYQANLAKTMVVSDRHTANVHFLPYCDSLLADLDANPTFARLLHRLVTSNPFRAFAVLKAVYFGINSPAQYRLFGHGRKPELAAAALTRLAAGTGISEKEKALMDDDAKS